jgi:hypothetical protein
LATTWCCHHGGHTGVTPKDGSVITLNGLKGNNIVEAYEDVLVNAKALRAELYNEFTARQLEVLRINQVIMEEEELSGFKVVKRDASSARDKLATKHAKVVMEANQIGQQIDEAENRLEQHEEAKAKLHLQKLKLLLAELKPSQLEGTEKLARLTAYLKEKEELKAKLDVKERCLTAKHAAKLNKLQNRIASLMKLSVHTKEQEDKLNDLTKQRDALDQSLAEPLEDEPLEDEPLEEEPLTLLEKEIEEYKNTIEAVEQKLSKLNTKIAEIELELKSSLVEAHIVCDEECVEVKGVKEERPTEKMFLQLIAKEQEALKAVEQCILNEKEIDDINKRLKNLQKNRADAIKLANDLKGEFDAACKLAAIEMAEAEAMAIAAMKERDVVKAARDKAAAALVHIHQFKLEAMEIREEIEARISNKRDEHEEVKALLETLKMAKKVAINAAEIATIDAQGKAVFIRAKALKVEHDELVKQAKDDDDEYKVKLSKLEQEAERLEAEVSKVMAAEGMRDLRTANKRDARLRELNMHPDIVNVNLDDSQVKALWSSDKGRSKVISWKSGQDLSLKDRCEALMELVDKARLKRVASVPWLASTLKQVQELIVEASGTKALCPVVHLGYKPLDVAGCMMQLKKQFGKEVVVLEKQTVFDPNGFDDVLIGNKDGNEVVQLTQEEREKLAIKSSIKPIVEVVARSSGTVARGMARRFRKEQDEENNCNIDETIIIKSTNPINVSTHAIIDSCNECNEDTCFSCALQQLKLKESSSEDSVVSPQVVLMTPEKKPVKVLTPEEVKALKEEKDAAMIAAKRLRQRAKNEMLQARNAKRHEPKELTDKEWVAEAEAEEPEMLVKELMPEEKKAKEEADNIEIERAIAEAKAAEAEAKAIKDQNLAAAQAAKEAKEAKAAAKAEAKAKAKACADAAKEMKDAQLKAAKAAKIAAGEDFEVIQVAKVKSAKVVKMELKRAMKAAVAEADAAADDEAKNDEADEADVDVFKAVLAKLSTIALPEEKKQVWWFGMNADKPLLRMTQHSANVCTTRIGPLPMIPCGRISKRFEKMGVFNEVMEEDDKYFLEYKCNTSGQSYNSIKDRVAVVLEELSKVNFFVEAKAADKIKAERKVEAILRTKTRAAAEEAEEAKALAEDDAVKVSKVHALKVFKEAAAVSEAKTSMKAVAKADEDLSLEQYIISKFGLKVFANTDVEKKFRKNGSVYHKKVQEVETGNIRVMRF